RCAQVRLLKTSSTMHLSCRSHRRRGIGGRNAPPRGERVYDPGGETMSTQQQERTEELPVSLGGAPVFVQTSVSPMKELDRWRQMGEEEARAVYEMTLRNELSGGTPVVREFEQAWREMTGTQHAITTMNGSSALFSAFFGVGVGPGDEVICPTYTWICTIGPALLLGARPVFAESDPRTLMLDPADVRRRLPPGTRPIVAGR